MSSKNILWKTSNFKTQSNQNNLKTSHTKLLKNPEVGFNVYMLHGPMGSMPKAPEKNRAFQSLTTSS